MGEQLRVNVAGANARNVNEPGLISSLRRAAAIGRDFAAIGREAVGSRPARAAEILTKMVDARLRHRVGPFDFFFADLFNRPRETWSDYMREQPHTDRMLCALHPAADERIT